MEYSSQAAGGGTALVGVDSTHSYSLQTCEPENSTWQRAFKDSRPTWAAGPVGAPLVVKVVMPAKVASSGQRWRCRPADGARRFASSPRASAHMR